MEMQGNATEIDERNLLQLDALLSHGYGLSPQLVMRSKGLSIEAKALYGYLSSFAGAGDTAFPSTSRILEELDISKNRFYKIRKELISWGFISIETTATSAGLRTVYTLPQNPIAIKTEIDEIANRRNEIKSSLVANLHNEDMVSHKGDSESERLQQLAGNEPCRQSEAKAQNRGSNLKPCLQSEDEGCLQSGDKLYIDTSINPKVSIDRSATRPSDDEVPSNWKVIEGMTDTTLRDDGESDRDANGARQRNGPTSITKPIAHQRSRQLRRSENTGERKIATFPRPYKMRSGRILQKIFQDTTKERRNPMSSNYQQKKMMNALGAIDTKGNIVLEQFQDGTALPAEQRAAVLRGYRL